MSERKDGKPKRKSTGRPCSICTHKQVSQINTQIADGVSFRAIALRYGMSHMSAVRHVESCLKLDIQAYKQQAKIEQVFDFETELQTLYRKATKMVFALEKWLVDPDNPDEFDIGPRDSEILVTYLDHKDKTEHGKPRRKKGMLDELLERVESDDSISVMGVASMAVDNRKLYLDAFKTLNDRLEQIAKFYGHWTKDKANPNDTKFITETIRDLVAEGIPEPQIREVLAERYPEVSESVN